MSEIAQDSTVSDEAQPEDSKAQPDKVSKKKVAVVQAPVHGPGSKVNWDNPQLDPTKRKSIADDPTGTQNAKLIRSP